MDENLKRIMNRVQDTADFADVDISAINACCSDGDNALHVIVRDGNLQDAKVLIDAGIDINKAGDLGYTPLHLACMEGHLEMVKLLVSRGADLFALSEGDSSFTTARLAGHDNICDFLGQQMTKAQAHDPEIWIKARISQLRREIGRLEAKLSRMDS